VVVRDLDGNPIGETVLNGEVWDTPLRADLVHHAVLWQRYDVFRPAHLASRKWIGWPS
jgi:ribosomal protein L4